MRAAAVAAVTFIACLAVPVRAHEPFAITTEARVLPGGLTLHLAMAGRTATLACPGAAGEPHRLTSDDVERHRVPLETCARGMYVVTSAGRRLEAAAALLTLTDEGDFDARLAYPPAAPGALVFDAVLLARLPDPMYGAELTVTGDRVFLGQTLLRASSPSFSVSVPGPSADPARRARQAKSSLYLELVGLGLAALALAWFRARHR